MLVQRLGRAVNRVLRPLGLAVRKAPRQDAQARLYRALYPARSIEERRFYNIGAGAFRHPAWTNVDHPSDWYGDDHVDLAHDLMSLQPLPIDSGQAEIVYCSHVIEHISDAAAAKLFAEALRVLKPGGVFRVVTPNIDLDYRAYLADDRHHFYWIDTYSIPENYERARYRLALDQASTEQVFLSHFAASASTVHADGAPVRIDDEALRRIFATMSYEDALDHCVSHCSWEVQRKYPGNHINWWNRAKLERMMVEAGFPLVYLSGYGQSRAAVLRNLDFFDTTHPPISLYMEGCRAAAEAAAGDGLVATDG